MNTIFFALILSYSFGAKEGTMIVVPDFESAQACERAAVTMKEGVTQTYAFTNKESVSPWLRHKCVPYSKK